MADEQATSSKSDGQVKFTPLRLVGVDYPGYVKDENHMLETLSGEEAVSRTYSYPVRRLELCFRPDDPYSHVVCGDRYPTANLLLKVKQRRKKKREGSNEPEEVKYEQEILGVVGTTFRFEVMADFQYLAPDMPDLLTEIRGSEALNQEVPLHMQPPVFARFDRPANYNYRPEPQTKPGCKADRGDDLDEERLAGTRTRVRRPVNAIAATFNMEEVPAAAHPKAVEVAAKTKDGQLEAIRKLFANRPIWSRNALQYHINVSQERLKQLLSSTAYYWLNGPWRTLWTRMSYDPRKDPSAKIYQMLDFRIGCRREVRDLPIKAKRSATILGLPNLVKKTSSNTPFAKGAAITSNSEKTDQSSPSQEPELGYVFTPNKLPKQKQTFYQYCDLHDPEIQQLIGRNDDQEEECLERDGWCLPGTNNAIRSILNHRTTELAAKMKLEDSEEGAAYPGGQLQATGEEWDGQEGMQSFLEMLENDDDIEAYDIFGDFDETGD